MTSTLNDPTLAFVSVAVGSTATTTFSEVTDSVDDAYSGSGKCGDRDYSFKHSNTGTPSSSVSWISVTEDTPSTDTHTITLSPTNTGLISGTPRTYYLATTYAAYPAHAAHYTALQVQFLTVGCDCSNLGWTNPSRTDQSIAVGAAATNIAVPPATVDESTKSGAGISACYLNSASPCSEGYTLSLTYTKDGSPASKPASITVNADST